MEHVASGNPPHENDAEPSPGRQQTHWQAWLPLVVLSAIGQIDVYITPFLVRAMTEGSGIALRAASIAISVEVAAMALGTIVLSRVIDRLNFRLIAATGFAMACAGHFGSFLAGGEIVLLIASRLLVGLGVGMGLAICYAQIGRDAHAARLIMIQSVILAILLLILFAALPRLIDHVGGSGLFAALTAIMAIAVPIATLIRTPVASASQGQPSDSTMHRGGWLLVLSVAAFGTVSNALWLHFEHVGSSRGVSYATIATILTTITIAGLAIPYVTLLMFRRWGNFIPLASAIALQLALSAAYLLITSQFSYIAFGSVLSGMIGIMLIYARMLASKIDATGRTTAMLGSGEFVGCFLGPLLGGSFAAVDRDPELFLASLAALTLVSLFALYRSSQASGSAPPHQT